MLNSLEAAGPDDAAGGHGVCGSGAVEEREELVGDDVVTEDAGGEDFSKKWFRRLF